MTSITSGRYYRAMLQKVLLIASIFSSLCLCLISPSAAASIQPPVLITEVQTGFIDSASGLEYPKQEFIELTNISATAVDITGWRLEYLSAAHDGNGNPTTTLATFNGGIFLNGRVLLNYLGYNPVPGDMIFGQDNVAASGMLAKSGGHVRLMNGDTMVDCVAWGSATIVSGCDKAASQSPPGHSIQRPVSDNGSYDKVLGVQHMAPPTPQGGQLYSPYHNPLPPYPNGPNIPGVDDEGQLPLPDDEPTGPDCSVISLSEVLPNPAGSDAESEFIELYNTSNQTVSLVGCSLRLGSAGKQYTFSADTSMAPHEYKAFFYATTNLQLTNSGGEVWLLTPTQQTSLTYPVSVDNQSWALIASNWQATFRPTPDAANVLHIKDDGAGEDPAEPSVTILEACPEGKFRNPATNRCKNLETGDTELTPCDPGQERNTETNRCRKVTTAGTVLTACDPGQERNPETNRCRKVSSAETTVKPCDPGQERNPETGRCRKVAGASTGTMGNGDNSKPNQNYRILVGVLLLILGYAVYEYRQDIRNRWNRLRLRLGGKSMPK